MLSSNKFKYTIIGIFKYRFIGLDQCID